MWHDIPGTSPVGLATFGGVLYEHSTKHTGQAEQGDHPGNVQLANSTLLWYDWHISLVKANKIMREMREGEEKRK